MFSFGIFSLAFFIVAKCEDGIRLCSILQVKAAFTRTYNKEAHLTPYAISSGPKKGKRKGGAGGGEGEFGEEGEDTGAVSEESDGEDVMADGMIKVSRSEMIGKLNLEPLDIRCTNGRLTIFHKAITVLSSCPSEIFSQFCVALDHSTAKHSIPYTPAKTYEIHSSPGQKKIGIHYQMKLPL